MVVFELKKGAKNRGCVKIGELKPKCRQRQIIKVKPVDAIDEVTVTPFCMVFTITGQGVIDEKGTVEKWKSGCGLETVPRAKQ